MRNILQRLLDSAEFETLVFGDKVILDEPIENWPGCDFLISFFSSGFPLQKAIDYVQLRRPFCVNDLVMQKILLDRRLVLLLLDAIGVQTPERIVVNRDNGPRVTADIRQRLKELGLLRQVEELIFQNSGCTSVEQVDDDTIKVNGKLLTKPFVEKPVDGEDHNIWIYYSKAQGGGVRKLFRKVANKASEFCQELSEVRSVGSFIYEVFMDVDNTEDVKVYTVGSEYIHAETRKSPVVDGIVQRNPDGKERRFITELSLKELDMARKICRCSMQTVCGLDLLRVKGVSYVIDVNGWSFVKGNQEYYDLCALNLRKIFLNVAKRKYFSHNRTWEVNAENQWRLKSFISVLRHADRTPKQKVKFNATSQPFIDMMNGSVEEVLFKKPEELKLVQQAAEESRLKNLEDVDKMSQLEEILQRKSMLPGTKVQIKPFFSKNDGLLERLQVVVKWGGEFTHAGVFHSKDLGENLRKDLMIINKEVLDDVKVFASAERRVLESADIFLKAFLDTSVLPNDLVQIRRDMLDDSYDAKEAMEIVKNRLQNLLNPSGDHKLPDGYILPDDIGDPAAFTEQVVSLLESRRAIMKMKFESADLDKIQPRWCCSESPQLFKERWDRHFKEFCDVERSVFDPSKVSELYDSLKYDALHNRGFMEYVFVDDNELPDPKAPLRDLYHKSKQLFDFVAPREYGVTNSEKLDIGIQTSYALLKQIFDDLQEAAMKYSRPSARLYFTKESHVHTLYNVIRIMLAPSAVEVTELDYLTQITFELYERVKQPTVNDDQSTTPVPDEYSLRIGFSPGAHDPGLIDTVMDQRHSLAVAPRRWITDHLTFIDSLQSMEPLLLRKGETAPPTVQPKLQLRSTTTEEN